MLYKNVKKAIIARAGINQALFNKACAIKQISDHKFNLGGNPALIVKSVNKVKENKENIIPFENSILRLWYTLYSI